MTDSRTSRSAVSALVQGDPDARTSRTAVAALVQGDPDARTSRTAASALVKYTAIPLSGAGEAASDGSGRLSFVVPLSSGHKAASGYLDLDNGGGEAVRTGQPDFLTSVDKDSSTQPTTSMTIRFDFEVGTVRTGQAILGPAFSTSKREWSLQYGASSGDLRFQVSSGGGSWNDNITVTPAGGLAANTRVQVKIVWSGTQLDVYEKAAALGVDYEGEAEKWVLLGSDASFMNISSLNDEASGPNTIGARTGGGRTQSTIRIYEYILEVDGSEVDRIDGSISDLNTTTDTFSSQYLSWGWLGSDGDLSVTAPTPHNGNASDGSGDLTVTAGAISLSGAGDAASDGDGHLTNAQFLQGHGDAASDGSGVLGVTSIVALSGSGQAASDGSGVLVGLTRLSGDGHAASDGAGVLTVLTIKSPADAPMTWYQIYEMNNGADGGVGVEGNASQFTQLPGTGSGTSGPSGGPGSILGHGTVVVTDDRPRILRPKRRIVRQGGRS